MRIILYTLQSSKMVVLTLLLAAGLYGSPLYGQDQGHLLDVLTDPAKSTQRSEPVALPFLPDTWIASTNARYRVENHLGRESLFLDGRILFPGTSLLDGIIEVDIAPNVNRSFAGIIFRVRPENDLGGPDQANFEEVYMRLHKSGMPDAIQYSPIYNGQSTWQLYREYQSAKEFKRMGWTHLKIVIVGEPAEVYLDDDLQPVLVVDRLRQSYEEGAVGLFALLGNHFANFRYTPFEVKEAPRVQPPASVAGTIEQWSLSASMPATEARMNAYPARESLSKVDWLVAQAEPGGLLPVSKYRTRRISESYEQNPEDMVWARVTITSPEKQEKKLFFDYSDKIVVYLNGRPVFAGNNAFRSKGILERGDLDIEGNAVFLDLEKGSNELLVTLAERANGWGILARLADPAGVTVTP